MPNSNNTHTDCVGETDVKKKKEKKNKGKNNPEEKKMAEVRKISIEYILNIENRYKFWIHWNYEAKISA